MHSSFAIAETEFALKDFKDAIFRLAIGESAHIRSMGLMSNSKIIADSTIYQTDLALDKLEFDVSGGQAGAINGALTVMCGADSESVFADVEVVAVEAGDGVVVGDAAVVDDAVVGGGGGVVDDDAVVDVVVAFPVLH